MMLRSAFKVAAAPATRSWLASATSSLPSCSRAAGAGAAKWVRYKSTGAASSEPAAKAGTKKAPVEPQAKKEKTVKVKSEQAPAKGGASVAAGSASRQKASELEEPVSAEDEALLDEALAQALQQMQAEAAAAEEKPLTVEGYDALPDVASTVPPNAKYDPKRLPLPVTQPIGTLTEEQHSASLIHGRSLSDPVYHKPLYQIPVASLHLRSYDPTALDFFAHFASHAAGSLGIPISKPVHLPTQRSMWTVPRSPFAHKKSQENFERKTYKRAIKVWDAAPEVVDLWCQYMSRHSLHGVGMKVTRWDRMELDAADTYYAQANQVRQEALKEAKEKEVRKGGKGKGKAARSPTVEGTSEAQIRQMAEKIYKEETKAKA